MWPNGAWPRSCPRPIASTRSSFRRSARATVREIWVTSSVWVRRVRKWSPSGETKTCVLCLSRRNALACTIRSRSRCSGERSPQSSSARRRRAGHERAASGASSASSHARRRSASERATGPGWACGSLTAILAAGGADHGRAARRVADPSPRGGTPRVRHRKNPTPIGFLEGSRPMSLKPDPTFYPSPASAIEGPPEELAYVVTLNTSENGGPAKPDALTVVDVKDGSSTKGQVIGRLDMPNVGDELHHFGWNACSSALCPWAPHPHVERRYLLVPGLRSSRIHVVDVKDNPAEPKLVKVVEAEDLAKRTGYSRPHTVHCGPDGLYLSALGAPDGGGPGGVALLDHDSFDPRGRWELDRGPQELAYDVWWNIGFDTLLTSEWGLPNMVEDGVNPELLLSNQYGHRLHTWDLRRRRHRQAIDLGPEHQMVLELRPAHDPTRGWGFVGVVVSTPALSASVCLWDREADGSVGVRKVITIPAEPAETEQLP